MINKFCFHETSIDNALLILMREEICPLWDLVDSEDERNVISQERGSKNYGDYVYTSTFSKKIDDEYLYCGTWSDPDVLFTIKTNKDIILRSKYSKVEGGILQIKGCVKIKDIYHINIEPNIINDDNMSEILKIKRIAVERGIQFTVKDRSEIIKFYIEEQ